MYMCVYRTGVLYFHSNTTCTLQYQNVYTVVHFTTYSMLGWSRFKMATCNNHSSETKHLQIKILRYSIVKMPKEFC